MKKSCSFKNILKSLQHYTVFFLVMAFVITCSMLLFLETMSSTTSITLTKENITVAAKLTFVNIVVLSLIFTAIDAVRRRLTLIRPVKKSPMQRKK